MEKTLNYHSSSPFLFQNREALLCPEQKYITITKKAIISSSAYNLEPNTFLSLATPFVGALLNHMLLSLRRGVKVLPVV